MEEWLIIIVRTVGLFVLFILAVSLIGRKPFSAMTFFDFVSGLVLAGMISLVALNVVTNLAHGLLGLLFWFLAILAVQYVVRKSKWAHDHLYGKEIPVIKEGKIMEENLRSAQLTGEELLSQLRRKNVFQVADVEFAVLEANGDITALPKRDKQPLTPKDMHIPVATTQEPQTVILDGNILDEPLTTRGLNRGWLQTELDKLGISAENIFLAQVDSMGELYVDLFDDSIQIPPPTNKELLMATLVSLESDFMSFGLETKDPDWKSNYQQYAKEMREIAHRLEPHLKT